MFRWLPLISLVICQAGCFKESLPILQPVVRITATLHPLPNWNIPGIEFVEVPASELSTFATLITPSSPYVGEQGIRRYPEMYRHIADVVVQHSDGSSSKLIVRDTGKNPPAISFDGRKYYYGGETNAFVIVQLLREYNYDAQKSPFNTSPIVRIAAKLHPTLKLEIDDIEFIEIPESEIGKFAKLIIPNKPSVLNISPETHYHVADVVVDHKDGTKSELIIRWTGKNLAAISLDGSKYFDGGSDAMSIVKLIQEYDTIAKNSVSKP